MYSVDDGTWAWAGSGLTVTAAFSVISGEPSARRSADVAVDTDRCVAYFFGGMRKFHRRRI